MNLGSLIDTLAAMPADAHVEFDNGRTPSELCSWRGIYAELTLDSQGRYDREVKPITVAQLLANAQRADGSIFEGKGGEFPMDRSTAVWADEYGDYQSIGITGLSLVDGKVIIGTIDLSDYR